MKNQASGDWVVKKLGEVTDIYGGGTPKRSIPEYWGNDVPWLTMEDTNNLNVVGTAQYISNEGLQNSNAQIVPAGSVNLSCTATVGSVTINRIPLTTNQQFNSFHPHNGLIPEFLAYELMYKKKEIQNLGGTTTIPFISKSSISNLAVSIPPINNQQKIASILSSVDDAIQKTDQIIQKTEKLKQGLADELLNSKSKNWKSFSLKELCNFTTGKLNSNQAVDNGKYPFFTCAKETFSIDRYSFNTKAVLLAGNNAAGIYSVKYYHGKFDAYQRTYVITVKDESVLDYHFLKELLNIRLNLLKDFSVGTNTKFLTLKLLLSLEVSLPPIDVQRQIVEILSTLDKKIDAENLNRDRLKLLKAGLMSDIFGQKVQIN